MAKSITHGIRLALQQLFHDRSAGCGMLLADHAKRRTAKSSGGEVAGDRDQPRRLFRNDFRACPLQ